MKSEDQLGAQPGPSSTGPLRTDPSSTGPSSTGPSGNGLSGNAGGRPQLAIIEDNADNLLLLEVILEEHYELDQYSDGPQGLAGLSRSRPDLLLLDISLPGMDGLEVLRRIRGDAKLQDLKVIALTAHAMAGDRERLLRAGFDAYLAKPILDESELFQAIDRLLA